MLEAVASAQEHHSPTTVKHPLPTKPFPLDAGIHPSLRVTPPASFSPRGTYSPNRCTSPGSPPACASPTVLQSREGRRNPGSPASRSSSPPAERRSIRVERHVDPTLGVFSPSTHPLKRSHEAPSRGGPAWAQMAQIDNHSTRASTEGRGQLHTRGGIRTAPESSGPPAAAAEGGHGGEHQRAASSASVHRGQLLADMMIPLQFSIGHGPPGASPPVSLDGAHTWASPAPIFLQQQDQQQPLQQHQPPKQQQQTQMQTQQPQQATGQRAVPAKHDGAAEFLSLWELQAKLPEPFDPRPHFCPTLAHQVSTQQLQAYFKQQRQRQHCEQQQRQAEAAQQAEQQKQRRQQQQERQRQLFDALQRQVQQAQEACSHLTKVSVFPKGSETIITERVQQQQLQQPQHQQQQQQPQQQEQLQAQDSQQPGTPTGLQQQQQQQQHNHHLHQDQQQQVDSRQPEAPATEEGNNDKDQKQQHHHHNHQLEQQQQQQQPEEQPKERGRQQEEGDARDAFLKEQDHTEPAQQQEIEGCQQHSAQEMQQQQQQQQQGQMGHKEEPDTKHPLHHQHQQDPAPSPSSALSPHITASPRRKGSTSPTSPSSSRPTSAQMRIVQGAALVPGVPRRTDKSSAPKGALLVGLKGAKYCVPELEDAEATAETREAEEQAGQEQRKTAALERQKNATLMSETLGLLHQNEAVLGQADMEGNALGNVLDLPPHISRPSENYDQVLLYNLQRLQTVPPEKPAPQERPSHQGGSAVEPSPSQLSRPPTADTQKQAQREGATPPHCHTPAHSSPAIPSLPLDDLPACPQAFLSQRSMPSSAARLQPPQPQSERAFRLSVSVQPRDSSDPGHASLVMRQQQQASQRLLGAVSATASDHSAATEQQHSPVSQEPLLRKVPSFSVSQLLGDHQDELQPVTSDTLFGEGSAYSTLLPSASAPLLPTQHRSLGQSSTVDRDWEAKGVSSGSGPAHRWKQQQQSVNAHGQQWLEEIPERVVMDSHGQLVPCKRPHTEAGARSRRATGAGGIEFRPLPTLSSKAHRRSCLMKHPSPTASFQAPPHTGTAYPRTPLSPQLAAQRHIATAHALSSSGSSHFPPLPLELLGSDSEAEEEILFVGDSPTPSSAQQTNVCSRLDAELGVGLQGEAPGAANGAHGTHIGARAGEQQDQQPAHHHQHPHHTPPAPTARRQPDPDSHSPIFASQRALSRPFTPPEARIMSSISSIDTLPATPTPTSSKHTPLLSRHTISSSTHPRAPTRLGASGAVPATLHAHHAPHWGSKQIPGGVPWTPAGPNVPPSPALPSHAPTGPSPQASLGRETHSSVSSKRPTLGRLHLGRAGSSTGATACGLAAQEPHSTTHSSAHAARSTACTAQSAARNTAQTRASSGVPTRPGTGVSSMGTPGLLGDSEGAVLSAESSVRMRRVSHERARANAEAAKGTPAPERQRSPPALQPTGLRMFVAKTVPGATLADVPPVEVPRYLGRSESKLRSNLVERVEKLKPKVVKGSPLPVSLLQGYPHTPDDDWAMEPW